MKRGAFTIALLLIIVGTIAADRLHSDLKRQFYNEMSNDISALPDVRLLWLDSLLSLPDANRPELLIQKISLLRNGGYILEARKLADKIAAEAKRYPLHLNLKYRYQDIMASSDMNDYVRAFAEIEEMKCIEKPDSLKYWDFRLELAKFATLNELGDNARALEALREAERLMATVEATPAERREMESRLRGSKVTYLIGQKDFDNAFKEIQVMRQLANNDEVKLNVLIQTAQIYMAKGENEMALKYIDEALAMPVRNRSYRTAIFLKSYCLVNLGRFEEALDLMAKMSADQTRDNGPGNLRSFYIIRSKAALGTHEFGLAYNSLDSALVVGDSMRAYTVRHQLQNAGKLIATTAQLRHVEKQRRALSAWTIATGIGLVVMLIVAGWLSLLIIKLRRQRHSDDITIKQAREALDEAARQRDIRTQEENELKRRQSTALMKLAHIQTGLDKIRRTVNSDISDGGKVAEIEKLLKEVNIKENLWDLFKLQLEETNQDFVTRLTEAHPDLSKAEIRMCCLITLNMSNKEMADMLDRSLRTVEVTKYNLRKKLNTEEPTDVYLRRFLKP